MKLRLLTAAMLVVTPLAAQALGLGRLVVDSGLDEPLNGQIELISPTSQEIKTLKASLASREDFDIAGIERPPHLFDIKYTVTQKSDGRYFLKVNTTAGYKLFLKGCFTPYLKWTAYKVFN